MKLGYLWIAITIVLLAVFFWPKAASKVDDGFTAEARGDSFYKNMACTCIGFTASQNNCKSCAQYTDCYGIPLSCHYGCYAKLNETWRSVYCGSEGAADYPKDKASCEARNGTWEAIGLSPQEVCVLPTADAGTVCTDSSQCQGACVAELSQSDYDKLMRYHIPIPTSGKCTSTTSSVGCNAYVENGVVNGILCVD